MLSKLLELFPSSYVSTGENLRRYSTFSIGGRAKYFVRPRDIFELADGVKYLAAAGEKYYVLGRGSNTLFTDEEYRGVIVSTAALSAVSGDGRYVYADCGASNGTLFAFCRDSGLAGMEFLAGIPGSVGGAVRMNAGAYGRCISDVLDRVWILRGGEVVSLSAEEMKPAYRRFDGLLTSDLVLRARFGLQRGDSDAIRAEAKRLSEKRGESQPLEYPSCGSVFKRPENGYAAELIDRAGLKGFSIGGAQVSEKHAGFIVNRGDAKFRDVLKLIDYIRKEVYNKYSIMLDLELIIAE